MVPYKSTQNSWIHFVLIPLMLILILFMRHFQPLALGIIGGATVILFLFHSLIIEVNKTYLRIKFGPGLFRKKIRVADIEDCKPVKHDWWNSFGIRINSEYIFYNVTGSDAVEITLKNKKRKVRIGTDEPEQVCKALQQVTN